MFIEDEQRFARLGVTWGIHCHSECERVWFEESFCDPSFRRAETNYFFASSFFAWLGLILDLSGSYPG